MVETLKIHPIHFVVEPIHFVVESVKLDKGKNITPSIKEKSIIQLYNNTSKVLKLIPRHNERTGTLYGIIDISGNRQFLSKSNYGAWISPIDDSKKWITTSSTKLELIHFKDQADYNGLRMTSMGTITVSAPLMYKCTDILFPKDKEKPKIPIDSIFYLLPVTNGYTMYNSDGVKYENVTIDKKDLNGNLLGNHTTRLRILYYNINNNNKAVKGLFGNLLSNLEIGTLLVTSKFDLNSVNPTTTTSPAPTTTSQAPTTTSQAPTTTSQAPTTTSQAPTTTSPVPKTTSQKLTGSSNPLFYIH